MEGPTAPVLSGHRAVKVFLCHAHADKELVRDLYSRLRSNGVDAWLDAETLIPGQDWQTEIRTALRSSDAILVCLSRNAVSKEGFVQRELRIALEIAEEKPEGAIFIIPAKLGDCDVPERLCRWHWVDLAATDGYRRLLEALRTRAASVQAAPPEMNAGALAGPREPLPFMGNDVAENEIQRIPGPVKLTVLGTYPNEKLQSAQPWREIGHCRFHRDSFPAWLPCFTFRQPSGGRPAAENT